MKNTNSGVVRYKMFNYENPEVKVDFHINITPYKIRHQHEYWEIIIVFENSIINVVNNERIELKEGDAIIIRPDDIHYTQTLKDTGHQLLNIEVRKEFFEEVLNIFTPSTLARLNAYPKNIPKIKCSFANYEKILHLMRLSQRYAEIGCEERQFFSKEMLMYVLFEYEEQFHSEQISEKKDRSFSTVMITLFNQIENIGLKLHEVCAKYPCSVEYAIRRFKLEGLETPNIVFRKIKLDYACTLLKSSDYRVLTICEKIGFNNLGHFNKLFFQAYGVSPKEYRKKYRA